MPKQFGTVTGFSVAMLVGAAIVAASLTLTGNLSVGGTSSLASTTITKVSSAETSSQYALDISHTGTINTTSGNLDAIGSRCTNTVTESAGGNTLASLCYAASVTTGADNAWAYKAEVSGASPDSRGYQVANTSTGTNAYGFHALVSGAATVNYGIKVGAVNGGTNRAIEASDGDVFLNTQSGVTQINGAATLLGATVTFGLGGTANTKIVEKHNTTPSLNASCTSGGSSAIVGSAFAMTVTVGATSTSCTITFDAFANAPTCQVSARATVARGALVVGSPTTTTLPLTTVTNSAIYDISCVGH